ncbi:Thoeris anti-defense Tad2 family protein [Chromobacterium violaceum]|uniref:Thoeris anti-defense 2-like domain-containing protein n=1 Tax=Chromobacterium violaceum TaxID=536 RepID=A0A202B2F2_CHRVL|nr:hypothetical protein [Chromobacterium violaceum]OVE45665.1 hypothetical protein CBW21_21985 [Chromobacterium violaceum]
MKFDMEMGEKLAKGGAVRRAAWDGNTILVREAVLGMLHLKVDGVYFPYAFSYEDATADDWELVDG